MKKVLLSSLLVLGVAMMSGSAAFAQCEGGCKKKTKTTEPAPAPAPAPVE